MWRIYASVTYATIGSDNGWSPGRPQDIIWTSAWISLIEPLGANFRETLIEIHIFSLKKCIWKCRLEDGGHFVSASMCLAMPYGIRYLDLRMMAWHLAPNCCKPLTLPMVTYCLWNYNHSLSRECIWKYHPQNVTHYHSHFHMFIVFQGRKEACANLLHYWIHRV